MKSDVLLREVLADDLPIFFEQQLAPDANYMAAFTFRDPTDRDAFNSHWTKILRDPNITIKTVLFEGQVAGNVAVYIDEEFGKPEVTYWIGEAYWGKGVATQALSAFLDNIKARPIYGRAAKDNVASIRVLEKCGFTITGSDRGFANARGEEIEEVILQLG